MFLWLRKLFRKKTNTEERAREGQQEQPHNTSLGFMSNEIHFEKSSESLLEYLRLKSKKTTIKEEKFNLNNVLNELSGSLSVDFMDSGLELIFDIDKSVPRNLIGDSLQLEKILTSLTRSLIQKDPCAEIVIQISQSVSLGANQKLQFKIIGSGVHLSREELKAFSVPYYDEELKRYIKLEFYVTKEIVSLMGGTLDIKSSASEGTRMLLSVPFKRDKEERQRKYRLPSKEMVGKKIFLVDGNYNSALAIKKMLSYFQHKVDIISAEYFQNKKVNLSSYDIAIFDEEMLTPHVISYLKNLKQRSSIKIVLLSSIFRSKHIDRYGVLSVVDAMADKPFSQERIFEMILDIERVSSRKKSLQNLKNSPVDGESDTQKAHRALFENKQGITPESFSVFSGSRLLVVDDNRINQKVLLHVLGESGIDIETASDGEEAVNMVLNPSKKYDMVLMDINMPVMDGYEATAMIRRNSGYREMPIVALTTLVLESEIEKMFAHGVSGYLSKPLEVGRLYAALERYLQKSDSKKPSVKTVGAIGKQFDGLDVAQGIRHANGNTVVYMEILKEFMAVYGQSAQMMRNLADDRNYAQMKLLCADMRNLTNTIGAHKVHTIADEMYKLFLYNNEQRTPQYIESYRREFEKLEYAIERYIEGGAQ